jgi:hypothetical protein
MAYLHLRVGEVTGIDLDYFTSAKGVYLKVCLIPTGTFKTTPTIRRGRNMDFDDYTLTFQITKKEYDNLFLDLILIATAEPDDLPIARFPIKICECHHGFQIRGEFTFINAPYYPVEIEADVRINVARGLTLTPFKDPRANIDIKAIQARALEPQHRSKKK